MPGLVIDREVLIEAPVEVVWRTITEPDQHQGGWAEYLDRLSTLLAKRQPG